MSKKLFFSLTLILVLILIVCLAILSFRQKTLTQPQNELDLATDEVLVEQQELDSIEIEDFEAEFQELQTEVDSL